MSVFDDMGGEIMLVFSQRVIVFAFTFAFVFPFVGLYFLTWMMTRCWHLYTALIINRVPASQVTMS